ncbi:cell adhesion molecule 1-like [Lingula anatina]|uniref:Cell adhesion molecule 1-like n=1 Tax=Lingula anatina TaxID=7574 RepID=A0A1S3JYX8_LINAN|nr:cell adhesion molecule 1-like [Lingula anatina]|eukprot:XP_013415507.1 cell adhesion molecule 1-like [Lingula anatina]
MKWYKADQEITTGFTQQTNINSDGCTYNGVSILSITPTSLDDGVMFNCAVEPNSTVIGDSSKQGRYTLDVRYPVPEVPTVTSSTGTWTVEQGATFTLNCQASGNPSPSFVWTSPDNTNSTGSQLVLTLSTTGNYLYTCFATNSLTTTPLSAGVTVTVQEKTTTTSTTISTTPVAVASSTTDTLTGGEVLHSTGVLTGAVVAAVVITFGVAVALFVLYHRSMVHRFRNDRQFGDTLEVDVMESNNEYVVLEENHI